MRPAHLVLAGSALLLLPSCFDPPVREDLRLRFLPNGAVVATSTVRIADPATSNPILERRLAEARREILDGTDAWSARFAAAEPAAERFGWEKQLGNLRTIRRSAVLTEPKGLEAFFRDTSVYATYTLDPERGVAELALSPGSSNRATRKQGEDMAEALEHWTESIAEYLAAGGALYAYLDDHPDRARPCLASLFGEGLSEEEAKSLAELTEEEQKLVDRLDDAMGGVVDVLTVPEGGAYSMDEVSHLVYDPFPAQLTVKLPGAPLEVQGFARQKGGDLSVPSPGLWEALKGLQGRWISPDPVFSFVESARESSPGPILEPFLKRPRRAAPPHLLPSAREVRAEIEKRLRPEPFYRVSWRIDPRDETDFRWDGDEAP